MDTIAIIGCGNMGRAMAQRLRSEGVPVRVFDQSEAARASLAGDGFSVGESAAEVAGAADVTVLSLPHADAVSKVVGDILPALGAGRVVVDTSTSDPAVTMRLAAQLAERDIFLLDAPVSGGPAGAAGGTMVMLVGGAEEALASVTPVLERMTAKIVHVGASGAGHTAKLANNMLCAANLVLAGEALAMGRAAGIAPEALIEGINAGSGRSAVTEVNMPRWILSGTFDSGFTMGLMRKDVRLAEAFATEAGLSLDGLAAIAEIWRASASRLSDTDDFNAIARDGEAAR